ncbi:hypothetical protein GBW32_12515 [Streptomyces tsukubensis]|uniref:Uncharacterized protein n=1 Tax=Streptomyces tsukubensis TaxID=83656 RepID=A0A1V4A714_9ACTN|nr:hypothetical protein B1H18_19975 [Streptomyces tsukubensis]QFR97699.1 hypothetical protein GBW32_12515 [Streptomyces tsukubensis]
MPLAVPDSGRVGEAKIREALDARDALAVALSRAGIQLPAMDVRTPWVDIEDDPDTGPTKGAEPGKGPAGETRYALVHLGICSAPVAHDLAAVILKGVDR